MISSPMVSRYREPGATQGYENRHACSAHYSGFENNSRIEDDKYQERVPNNGQWPWPASIGFEPTKPPPTNVRNPADQKQVVYEQPATPPPAGDCFSLGSSISISCRVTPSMIELKCAYDVS
jgi:hypothetical protein